MFVNGFLCADGAETLKELAKSLNDIEWEQAFESALRKKLLTIDELESCRNERVRRG